MNTKLLSKAYPIFGLMIFLASLMKKTSGANILMSGVQFASHIHCQVEIAEELASKGHNVYLAITARYPNLKSIEAMGIKTLTYTVPLDEPYGPSKEFDEMYRWLVYQNPGTMYLREIEIYPPIVDRHCNHMMNDSKFIEKVRGIKFDVAVVEPFVLGSCNLILPKYFNIPFVMMSASLFPWDVRLPALPSFYNILTPWRYKDLSSFKNRLISVVEYVASQFEIVLDENTDILKRYTNYTTWKQLMLEAQLFIHQFDYILDDGLPTMPHVIRVPGITPRPVRPLPKDIESVVSQAKNGIIVLSFGGTAYELELSVLQTFLTAFAQLNETVLVRFKIPEGVTVPKNVLAAKWLPQNDLLGNPKTKLFITHCGCGGLYEMIYHSVPMVAFPLFAEQARNSQKAVARGFGVELNFHNFTADQLVESIHEVLNNPKYAKTVEKFSQISRSSSMTGRQSVVYWIEHIVKFGGEHLRSAAMDMPMYQFLMLDILATVSAVLLILILFTYILIKFVLKQLFKCFSGTSEAQKVKKQK